MNLCALKTDQYLAAITSVATFCLVTGWLAVTPTVAAEYQFQVLEFPGADFTIPQGINNDGVVVGGYGTEDDDFPLSSGFVWEGGEFVSRDFGYLDSLLSGVNDAGTVVGTGFDLEAFSAPVFTAALSGDSEVSEYILPEALALSGGINNAGDFVGGFISDLEDQFQAFARLDGEFGELDVPGLSNALAADINDAGQIVGGAMDEDGTGVGFILQGTDVTLFNHPDGETELLSINNVGAIAGATFDDDSSRTFIFDGTTFQDFTYPGADDVVIWDMNDHGVVVGQYFIGDSEVGFVATPVPEPAAGFLFLFGVALLVRGPANRFRA